MVQVVVELILRLMNFPTELLGHIISHAMQAIEDIKRDPVGFLMNMLEALKLGFSRFFDNILGTCSTAWWTGCSAASSARHRDPDRPRRSSRRPRPPGARLTVEQLWEKLAEHIGPERVEMIRDALDTLGGRWTSSRTSRRRGIAAIWEYVATSSATSGTLSSRPRWTGS